MRNRRHRGEASPSVPTWLRRRGEHVSAPRRGDTARIAAIASSAGAPVDEVLREVADFRLALETDMIIAAAAVDSGELELAADVVDGDRAGLADFHERMLSRLVDIATDEHAAPRGARWGGRARLVAAAATLVALVGGGATVSRDEAPSTSTPSTEQVALQLADDQLSTLTGELVRDASSAEIATAASELHNTLETLIAEHAQGDPAVASMIAELIVEEQRLLRVEGNSATPSMLRDVARLVRQLKRVAPPQVVATLLPVPSPPPPSASAKPTPKPTASSKPKPSPSPSRSSAAPSPSPSSSKSSAAPQDDNGDGGGAGLPTPAP